MMVALALYHHAGNLRSAEDHLTLGLELIMYME